MDEFSQKTFRVLIVDDTEDIHDDLRRVLSWGEPASSSLRQLESALFDPDHGKPSIALPKLKIDSAYQGLQAVEMVTAAVRAGTPYHLIFMDVRMPPGIDGIEATQKIWQADSKAHVIICTAYSDYSIDSILAKTGISDRLLFLSKPFSPPVIKQSTITLLKKYYLDELVEAHVQNLEKLVEDRTSMLVQSSKMAALGEMSGGIAHEINTPLCAILLAGQRLEERLADDLDPVLVAETLGTVTRMSKRIAKIVTALRSVSRTSEGDPFESVELAHIIEDMRMLCTERFLQAGIALDFGTVPSICLDCRPIEIAQVLLNLLNNAFDAASELTEKWVRLDYKTDATSIRIGVTDSGRGIPAMISEKIFDPFYTTKEVGKGTGLGLSVSRSFVEGHHGTLTLDPKSANTLFTVELPLQQKTPN